MPQKGGIFVLDRGGDRRSLYGELLKEDSEFRFIIRQRGDRHLLSGGKLRETLQLAQSCKTAYGETVSSVPTLIQVMFLTY
jgi:hypothetical protein